MGRKGLDFCGALRGQRRGALGFFGRVVRGEARAKSARGASELAAE